MKSSQIRDLTEKTKKMAEKTKSGGSRKKDKKSRKERKPKGTSLTQYGVTSTKKELREMVSLTRASPKNPHST